jgi:hypothetical protein
MTESVESTTSELQVTPLADGNGAFEFTNTERDILFVRNENDQPITVSITCAYPEVHEQPYLVSAHAERAVGPFMARVPSLNLTSVELYGNTVRLTCSPTAGVSVKVVTLPELTFGQTRRLIEQKWLRK